ncbi:MAG: leucine--tRNA ligase, partial [Chloroflexi bacterium]|nr:leucine--tRNA ligase [Chloroflexota bacterium]
EVLGKPYSIHTQPWPELDEEATKEDILDLAVQINGKVRDRIQVPADMDEEAIKALALSRPKVQKWLQGKEIKKVRYIPGRLVSIQVG